MRRLRSVIEIAIATVVLLVLSLRGVHHREVLQRKVAAAPQRTLISYSYFEADAIQRDNLLFFLSVGWGWNSTFERPRHTSTVVVVSSTDCTHCRAVEAEMTPIPADQLPQDITKGYAAEDFSILYNANEGMDFGAHNATLRYTAARNESYSYYVFLNSSVRGPFVPSYMPAGWQWTHAYTSRITDTIKVVSSSLVCLHEGSGGPSVESWAWAVDQAGLDILVRHGVMNVHAGDKMGDDGPVERGEKGISRALQAERLSFATLLSKYRKDIDWNDKATWGCNKGAYPSRWGWYDGLTQHPFETVFVKATWFVGEPFSTTYARWFTEHAANGTGAEGRWDATTHGHSMTNVATRQSRNFSACYEPLPQ